MADISGITNSVAAEFEKAEASRGEAKAKACPHCGKGSEEPSAQEQGMASIRKAFGNK